jgi:large subunit ribosomal protein L5
METVKEKNLKSYSVLQEKLNIKNKMAAPKLVKVIVSAGTGSIADKNKKALILDRLSKITAQKASVRGAKKSIAGFKIRQGDIIGAMVTLRGDKMNSFLDKLIHIAIPRMRDFKGISTKSIDSMGNLTIGITEHTIFPETSEEDLKDVFGLSVTVVTTAKNREEALAFLASLGFPFKEK